MISRIERELNQESMKKRLKNPPTTIPKSDPRKIILKRLLNERVDRLRKEFVGNRLNRKTALVKEQVQTQRLKQQQLILKQQQQATTIKQEESSSDDDDDEKKANTPPPPPPPPPPVKKPRKSTGNETKKTPKTSEQKTKR
jgi:hypothetical protein